MCSVTSVTIIESYKVVCRLTRTEHNPTVLLLCTVLRFSVTAEAGFRRRGRNSKIRTGFKKEKPMSKDLE